MSTELRVLMVEDSTDDAELVALALREGGYDIVSDVVATEASFVDALGSAPWDVILCDHNLPHFDSIKALKLLQAQGLDIPFIIVSGAIGEEAAVAAMKAGASDYVMKDRLARLAPAIEREIREMAVRREKRRTEAALLLNEARLTGIVGSAMDAIVSIDGNQRIVLFNQAAETMFGYCAEEMLGRPIDLLLPERYRVPHRAHIESFAKAGVTSRTMGDLKTLSGRRRNGDEFPIEASISQMEVSGEHYFTVIVRDVTERVHAQEALEQSEAWFRALLENSYDAIAVIDTEGVFTYVDKSVSRVLGHSPADLQGTNGFGLVHPEDLEEIQAAFFQLLQSPRDRTEVAFRARHADGSWRWLDLTGANLVDDLRIGGVIVNFRDVTARKEAEAALREADRQKDEFLATLAHELRNPLASIVSAVELMSLVEPPDPDIEESREIIARQAGHMKRLLDDLLDVARITSGRITLQREPLEAARVIERAVEMARPVIDERGHHLTIESPTTTVRVEGDLTRLAQVVSNLLSNAAKYTTEGGQICLTAEATEEEVLFRVRDNGIGIALDTLPGLFKMFARASHTASEGLGVGLALVRTLVELHGGHVEARSEGLGKGSEFVVRLPRLKGSGQEEKPSVLDADPHPVSGQRILVVDDNHDLVRLTATLLQRAGYEVETASDGPTALRMGPTFRPSAVLLDIGLPGMDGLEVARRMREQPETQYARIIALSGYGQERDFQRSREAGCDAHLVKPVTVDALKKILEPRP